MQNDQTEIYRALLNDGSAFAAGHDAVRRVLAADHRELADMVQEDEDLEVVLRSHRALAAGAVALTNAALSRYEHTAEALDGTGKPPTAAETPAPRQKVGRPRKAKTAATGKRRRGTGIAYNGRVLHV
jgi:hypothetical protein